MRVASRVRVLLVFALVMALGIPLAAVPAVAGPGAQAVGGVIQGTVRDTLTGQPITWDSTEQVGTPIAVEIWHDAGGWWEQVTDEYGNPLGFTADDGTYRIEDVAAGTYYVRFVDFWWTGYRSEFYNDAYDITDATPVVVTSGGTATANISLSRIEWGKAAGTITDATSGATVHDVSVEGWGLNGLGDWEWVWSANSLSLGDWMADAPAGEYKVQFTDWYGRYLPQFYGGGTSFDSAPFVTIAPTHTTPNLNAVMVRAGHIQGTVTRPGGTPLKGVWPLAYTWNGSDWVEANDTGLQEPTSSSGVYDIGGLVAGTYRVVFRSDDGSYIQEAWNNHSAPGIDPWQAAASGNDIVVGAGATVTGKNAELAVAGRISGHVADAYGAVPWATVEVLNASEQIVGTTWADENGDYVVGNLGTGSYRVKFYYSLADDPDWYYNPNYYNAKTSFAAADAVAVTAGSTTSNINATLVAAGTWGRASGTVTDATTGKELENIGVGLMEYDSGWDTWYETDYTWTDSAGQYRFKYVPVGQFKVVARDDGRSQFGPMYAEVVSAPQAMTGNGSVTVNFALAEPTEDFAGNPVGMIHGTITDGVNLLPGVPVSFYQYDDFSGEYWYGGEVRSNSGGEYVVSVPVGTWVVQGGPAAGYVSEYYQNKTTPSTAMKINVTAGNVYGPYALALGPDNRISGTVTDGSGQPISDAYVSALRFNSDWNVWEPVTWDGVTNCWTAEDGTYTLYGLPAGTYKVAYYAMDYGSRWWRTGTAAQSVDQAGTIVFGGVGATSSGKNVTLTEDCELRGSVTDEDGVRATGIKVNLWWNDPVAGWAVIQSTYAYHDGDFQFLGFTGGNYRLEFTDDEHYLYAASWYENVPDLVSATLITMLPGETRVIQQTVVATDTEYSPVFGTNRIETAIKSSQLAFPDGSATTVVIATGYNWPDALGGAALAGAYAGPILLTDPGYLPNEVLDEIERLGATDAIILGGTVAVSGAVESTLKSNIGQYHVRRLAGENRYETAALVAEETVARLGTAYDGTAFIATGENFPDALGASPLAASASWPIYLTSADALTPLSRSAMEDHGVSTAIILGETGAVSAAVETELETMFGSSDVVRLGGATRYETCVEEAQYGIDNIYGLGWNNVAIATGQNYPDALAGGVLQGKSGSVLLLTPTDVLDGFVATKLAAKKSVIVGVRYIGGPNAVSQAVRDQVQALLY